MNLKNLNDDALLECTEAAALTVRESITRLLHHLAEVQRRRLFARVACASLFDYCVRVLHMSQGEAARRVNASRALAEFPELEEKIASGTLTVTAINQAQVYFKSEHKNANPIPRERTRQITPTLTEVKCVLDEAAMADLERLREIWSYALPNASTSDLIKKMAGFCRAKLDPDLKGDQHKAAPAPD